MTATELFPVDAPLGDVREIAADTFALNASFWGFPNVVYLLRSGRAWALVDSGIAETPALAIAPFLCANGGWESLELVLGTHGHLDHIGGNGWLKQHAPAARFALGALDAGWAEDVERHYVQLYVHGAPGQWRPDPATELAVRAACGTPVAIDHPLVGGEVLTFGDGREIEARHLGAHSPGQILYLDRQTGCAFSGDAVQGPGTLSVTTGQQDFPMYRTPVDYLRSLETIRSAAPAVLCTAHRGVHRGEPVTELLDESISWLAAFDDELRDITAARGDLGLEEAVDAVLERRPGYARGLQVRVTTAEHLDGLVRDGHLQPYLRGTQKRWRTTNPLSGRPSHDHLAL